jgi:hypothetical protein
LAYLNKVICLLFVSCLLINLKNKNYANFFGNLSALGLLLGIGTANNTQELMALIRKRKWYRKCKCKAGLIAPAPPAPLCWCWRW